jgi:hypothetical protein
MLKNVYKKEKIKVSYTGEVSVLEIMDYTKHPNNTTLYIAILGPIEIEFEKELPNRVKTLTIIPDEDSYAVLSCT